MMKQNVLISLALINFLALGLARNSESSPTDFCIEIDKKIENGVWNITLQEPECNKNLTIACPKPKFEEDSLEAIALSNMVNNTEACVILLQKNSSACYVLDKVNVYTYGDKYWTDDVTEILEATCTVYDTSFSVCVAKKDAMCKCNAWYLVEHYCVVRNDCQNYNSYLFSYPLIVGKSLTSKLPGVCENTSNLLENVRALFMLVLVGISVFSLAFSVIVHLILFRSSHDILPLLCHKITLLICYVSFLLRSFRTFSPEIINCSYGALYFSSECFFLASFCWLNVLAYEMWRQFHPKRVFQRCLHHFKCSKLIFQSMYGWGAPVVLMSTYCLLHLITDNHLFLYEGRCPVYFKRNVVQVIFIAAVNEAALFISMVLFVLTVINIKKIKASAAEASNNKRMFWTYVKLMTMASFSAAFYVLKSAIPPKGNEHMYWIPADILISLQGFLLFLLDCSNTVVRRYLKKFLHRTCDINDAK